MQKRISIAAIALILFVGISLALLQAVHNSHAAAVATLKVQYKAGISGAPTLQMTPNLQIVNTGADSVALNQLTLRYWFTRDSLRNADVACDWAQIGCANVNPTIQNLATPVNMADAFIQVAFTGGTVQGNSSTGDIMLRADDDNNVTSINQTNDYSYNGAQTTYADSTKVTLYLNGQLVWGVEPTGAAVTPPPVQPTATPTIPAPPASTPTVVASTPTAVPATPQPTTAPTGGGSNSGLPAHALTGYWQDFTNGSTALPLSGVNPNYDIIAVAFANADPANPGGVTFSIDSGLSAALGGYTADQFTKDIATLHAQGKKVIISVGGQNGAISVADAASATNFANSVSGLMQTYGFDGVDIDLENGINPTFMANALQQLSAKAGPGLVITMAPQTIDMQSPNNGYFQLALNIKNILTVVNMQYYNSGTMLGCDGNVYAEGTENFLTALACIQLQNGLRPDQVALGLPASTSAAGGGYVAPSVVNAALDCLASGTNCGTFKPPTTYPTIRGAMTWSINWDAANGSSFANTVKPHLNALP